MKKFYEAPVVELTGFSVEDVITTSVVSEINTLEVMTQEQVNALNAAATYNGYDRTMQYNGAYQW